MFCSHGAGRKMSRAAAKEPFTLADHVAAAADVECRKDEGVRDEAPGEYKPIDVARSVVAQDARRDDPGTTTTGNPGMSAH